jgi:EAL domain-containing protein (putative c-di-GMP-specific phosphodiesterase class I)
MTTWLRSLKARFIRKSEPQPDTGSPEQGNKSNFPLAIENASPVSSNVYPPQGQKPKLSGGTIEGLLFGLGLLFFASLILGFIAFTRPLWQDVPADIAYQQVGAYIYSAAAPAGVYDTGTLVSGEPIFPKLTCQVTLNFKYTFLGNQFQGLTGTHQVTAQVGESISGWQRTLPLESLTTFSGNTFAIAVPLDICQAEAITTSMENETDLHPALYSLVIQPQVQISGSVNGKIFHDTFNPALDFQFDKVHAYLIQPDPKIDPLNPTTAGLIKNTPTVANTLLLFGLQLEITKLRNITAVGLGISVIGLLLLGFYIYRASRRSQDSYVQMKYGSLLVDVQSQALETTLPAVDVVSMDDLAKLAERNNAMILHEQDGAVHSYFVLGDRFVYRYTIGERGAPLRTLSPLQEMETKLRKGFERGEFQVYYQPIMSLPDGKVNTVEALLRWRRPEGDIASAGDFIREAEETGLIDAIGDWMLEVAVKQLKQWQDTGNQINLAVNLSHRQLMQGDPAESILRLLERTHISPQMLQIEVPESTLRERAQGIQLSLQKLKDAGVQIAVDNLFSQSAISTLGGYPIHSIKIDRQRIEKIGDPKNDTVISAIIQEAHELGLDVVAEGVETKEELDFLSSKLCPQAQGYLLGRPAPADALTKLLQEEKDTPASKPPVRRRVTKEKTQ